MRLGGGGDELPIYTVTWMNLKIIMLSEEAKPNKSAYCTTPFIESCRRCKPRVTKQSVVMWGEREEQGGMGERNLTGVQGNFGGRLY